MESRSFERFEPSEEAHALREKLKRMMYDKKKRDKILTFTSELQTRHSIDELHEYEAYRALAGSTSSRKPEYFDLESDDSIVQFIDELAREMEDTEEK